MAGETGPSLHESDGGDSKGMDPLKEIPYFKADVNVSIPNILCREEG